MRYGRSLNDLGEGLQVLENLFLVGLWGCSACESGRGQNASCWVELLLLKGSLVARGISWWSRFLYCHACSRAVSFEEDVLSLGNLQFCLLPKPLLGSSRLFDHALLNDLNRVNNVRLFSELPHHRAVSLLMFLCPLTTLSLCRSLSLLWGPGEWLFSKRLI